jgi:tetratricopeptide (TPR) repeat protein
MTPERWVTSLKLFTEDGRLIVRDGGVKFEVDSGQQVLDFDVSKFAREVDGGKPPRVSGILDNAERMEEMDPARTIRFYSTMVDAEPTNAKVRMKLAALLEKIGNPRGALKQYLHSATIAPDSAEAHLRVGVIYRMCDRLEQSIKSFLRVLKLDADNLEAHRNLAELYEEIGRKREALRHLSAIHRLTRSE